MDELARGFVEFLAEEQTQFVGSWLIVLLSLGLALRVGLPQFSKASEALKDAAEIKSPDRRITRWDTKLKRIRKNFGALRTAICAGVWALFPIVVLPLGLLALLTLQADRFFGAPAIIVGGVGHEESLNNFAEVALFFVDQLSRGLLFDAMEVFEWELSSIQPNTQNTPYLSALVAFRMIVDIYVVGFVVLVIQGLYGVVVSSLKLLDVFDLFVGRAEPK